MSDNQYHDIHCPTSGDIEVALANDDVDALKYCIVGVALYWNDGDAAESLCLKLCRHPDNFVRGNAILGFGHLARRFKKLSAAAEPAIRGGLTDDSFHVSGNAWAAASDVNFFLGWNIEH